MNISMFADARRATYTPRMNLPDYDMVKDTPYDCWVLGGPLQEGDITDGIAIYMIIEIADGRLMYASPERIRFTDNGGARC